MLVEYIFSFLFSKKKYHLYSILSSYNWGKKIRKQTNKKTYSGYFLVNHLNWRGPFHHLCWQDFQVLHVLGAAAVANHPHSTKLKERPPFHPGWLGDTGLCGFVPDWKKIFYFWEKHVALYNREAGSAEVPKTLQLEILFN